MSLQTTATTGFESQLQSAASLSDAEADSLVAQLKNEVDRHWWIDANHSVEFANQIIAVGETRHNPAYIALGTMARGDSRKLLGQVEDAWRDLERAGQLYLDSRDEFGWARTRIGRLPLSMDVNCISDALNDAEKARAIFDRSGKPEFIVRVLLNTAAVHNFLGDHQRAIAIFQEALGIARSLGAIGENYLGMLYNCIGYAYNYLGDYRQAQTHYEYARAEFSKRGELSGAAITEQNIAFIERARGHYQQALRVLHNLLDQMQDQLPLETAMTKRGIVECYLYLNRHQEARELAQEVLAEYKAQNVTYEVAKTYLYLATIEAEQGYFAKAQQALEEAEPIFESRGASNWLADLRLRRGQIALKQGDAARALQEAEFSAASFLSGKFQINYAEAMLLKGKALLADGALDPAAKAGHDALLIACQTRVPSLQYAAHLFLGSIAEKRGNLRRAVRQYSAAAATVARVQRNLTITMRPNFLEDKGDALRSLIRLHLQAGEIHQAFEALERAKSQVLLGYLANRESLHWNQDDAHTQDLILELNHLRDEHQWFYDMAQGQAMNNDKDRSPIIDPVKARHETLTRERRMRAITERLYLHAGETHLTSSLQWTDIQSQLDDDTLLIEFHNDGSFLWAFTLNRQQIDVHPLNITVSELDDWLEKLQFNIDCALRVPPDSAPARTLTQLVQRIAGYLYRGLLEPLADALAGYSRLVIVPYGSLHYLPFHLLHTGSNYLIEQHEIVILPSAGLITRPPVQRKASALVLAHSWNRQLTHTRAEAAIVQQFFGGTVYSETEASGTKLLAKPGKILHIVAHGEYRIDQPGLSYIHLDDRHLLIDDLIQQDLSYELVTLSACETGRAKVAPGDELIGLGSGFLYAGAGALIASLWRVNDAITVNLMEFIYHNLVSGASKASALRQAQCAVLKDKPGLHPAYWGAFQLIGDASPLSP